MGLPIVRDLRYKKLKKDITIHHFKSGTGYRWTHTIYCLQGREHVWQAQTDNSAVAEYIYNSED